MSHPPCLTRWGISSSGNLRRCRPQPSGTLDRTASPPSPLRSPAPRSPLHIGAEAETPQPAYWMSWVSVQRFVSVSCLLFRNHHSSSVLGFSFCPPQLCSSGGCGQSLTHCSCPPAIYRIHLSVHQCWASLHLPLSGTQPIPVSHTHTVLTHVLTVKWFYVSGHLVCHQFLAA